MGSKYLYGASVQGIQSFIFQTSKLTEIVGASELVEQICTSKFCELAGIKADDKNMILNAAGNIKYIFDSEQSCQNFVRIFPKKVMEMAPGITISQAVVQIVSGEDSMQVLEDRLRIQRNKAVSNTDGVGLMVTETARKTGGVGVKYSKDGQVIDLSQKLKQEAYDKASRKLITKIAGEQGKNIENFPFDISQILSGEENKSWIAVIHADGNNLGQLIIQMGNGLSQEQSFKTIKNFSGILNSTTEKAAKKAFEIVVTEKVVSESKSGKIPFRPVVLGGDDLTAIIRADLALSFTKHFLLQFEYLSKLHFKDFAKENELKMDPFENGMTACAGIAFIKANYPFHYGVSLAEKLCSEAKTISKKLDKHNTPSSLMFHKVHASFVEEYEDIVEAELTAKDNIQFNYGPYFIGAQPQYGSIEDLENWIKTINKKDAPKASLRNWLSELRNSPASAEQLLSRIASLQSNKKYVIDLKLNEPFVKRKSKIENKDVVILMTPIFDVMALSNF